MISFGKSRLRILSADDLDEEELVWQAYHVRVSALANEHYYAVQDDVVVGAIHLWVASDMVQVKAIEVLPGARRQGVGTALYEQAAWLAAELDCSLYSDSRLSPDSSGFWQKQVDRERATFDADAGVYVLKPQVTKLDGGGEGP